MSVSRNFKKVDPVPYSCAVPPDSSRQKLEREREKSKNYCKAMLVPSSTHDSDCGRHCTVSSKDTVLILSSAQKCVENEYYMHTGQLGLRIAAIKFACPGNTFRFTKFSKGACKRSMKNE
jgi:hypothetical protein